MGESSPFPGSQQSTEERDCQILPRQLWPAETGVSGGVEGGEGRWGHVQSPHLSSRRRQRPGTGRCHQQHASEVNNNNTPPLAYSHHSSNSNHVYNITEHQLHLIPISVSRSHSERNNARLFLYACACAYVACQSGSRARQNGSSRLSRPVFT